MKSSLRAAIKSIMEEIVLDNFPDSYSAPPPDFFSQESHNRVIAVGKNKKKFEDLKQITVHKRRGRPPKNISDVPESGQPTKKLKEIGQERCAICGDLDYVQRLPGRNVWVCEDAKKGCALKALQKYPKKEADIEEDQ